MKANSIQHAIITFLFVLIIAAGAIGQETTPDDTPDPAFLAWLETFRAEALEKGIRPETIDLALKDVKLIKRVVTRDRNQPEVVQTYADYLSRRVSDWRKKKGREMMTTHSDSLSLVSARHNVQSRFIASIWGVETNYGTVPLSYSVFDAIATLAYDKRRGPRFRRELHAALKILDAGYADFEMLKGSWAGAMGQPQFMPESYLQYAVDHDGDGRRDIWSTNPDVFASIANYLKSWGWRDDQTWGRPVTIPKGNEKAIQGTQAEGVTPANHCKAYKSMGVWRDLSDWQKLGVRRADGSDLPTVKIPAAIIIADEGDEQAYLVYQNFCSIMRYNPSFKYALAVGLLSDTIRP